MKRKPWMLLYGRQLLQTTPRFEIRISKNVEREREGFGSIRGSTNEYILRAAKREQWSKQRENGVVNRERLAKANKLKCFFKVISYSRIFGGVLQSLVVVA